jgi:hypothetical protein
VETAVECKVPYLRYVTVGLTTERKGLIIQETGASEWLATYLLGT